VTRRRIVGIALVVVQLAGFNWSTTHSSTSPKVTAAASISRAASVRWVDVAAATLWVRPRVTRPVDRPSLGNPVDLLRWVHSMTVAQKRWLVGRLETQALYGAKVIVLATSGTWSRVDAVGQPTPRDPRGYPGWVPSAQLTTRAPRRTSEIAVVTATTALVRRLNGNASILLASYDTRFPIIRRTSSTVEVSLLDGTFGFLLNKLVVVHPSSPSSWRPVRVQIVSDARRFLGLQYLWAGTAGFGYDCSGFVYSIYHARGLTLGRDASAQFAGGVRVSRADLKPGDLVFLRDSAGAIVHVAMFYGPAGGVPSVIQSPQTGKPVQITKLVNLKGYAGARRYLSS